MLDWNIIWNSLLAEVLPWIKQNSKQAFFTRLYILLKITFISWSSNAICSQCSLFLFKFLFAVFLWYMNHVLKIPSKMKLNAFLFSDDIQLATMFPVSGLVLVMVGCTLAFIGFFQKRVHVLIFVSGGFFVFSGELFLIDRTNIEKMKRKGEVYIHIMLSDLSTNVLLVITVELKLLTLIVRNVSFCKSNWLLWTTSPVVRHELWVNVPFWWPIEMKLCFSSKKFSK